MVDNKPLAKETSDKIILDKQKILESLQKNEKYEEEGILMSKWESDNNCQKNYVADINKNGIKFLGVINSKMQRNGYGLNYYPNGERYFGQYEKDLRNRQGIYIWPSKISEDKRYTEYYWGTWRNNRKDDHGVYFWLCENQSTEPFSNFEKADFDAYIGGILMDEYTKGTFLSKKKEDYYVYHGTFSKDGKKNGDNCFYYNATYDHLYYGKVADDKFVSGYLAQFDSEGQIFNISKVAFNENKTLSEFIEDNKISEEEKEPIKQKMLLFRNVIMEEDIFGEIYEKFKEIINYVDTSLVSTDNFNDEEKFALIIKNSSEYNKFAINKNIIKNVQ